MRQRRDDEVSDGRCMIELFRPDRCQQAQETEESRTEKAEPKNGQAMDRRHMHIRPAQHGQPDRTSVQSGMRVSVSVYIGVSRVIKTKNKEHSSRHSKQNNKNQNNTNY